MEFNLSDNVRLSTILGYTYYSSIRVLFDGRRLRKELLHPDSTYQKGIETFSMVYKERRYSRKDIFLSKCSTYYM